MLHDVVMIDVALDVAVDIAVDVVDAVDVFIINHDYDCTRISNA